jgi:hypothetical protein
MKIPPEILEAFETLRARDPRLFAELGKELARRLGFELNLGPDSLHINDSFLGLNDAGCLLSLDPNDKTLTRLWIELLQTQFQISGEPERLVIAGDDLDYIWPKDHHAPIESLPFRCHHCGARVKSTRVADRYDRVYHVCLCMIVWYRPDILPARSGLEWTEIRDKSLREEMIISAKAADVTRKN